MGVKILAGRPDEKDFFFATQTTLLTTPDRVKCKTLPVFTLEPRLTVPGPVLLLEHNQGVEPCHKCLDKPIKT
jgi:hypothetical protein